MAGIGKSTEEWIRLVLDVSFGDLPKEVVTHTIDYIIDHIGNVISGCNSSVGQALIKFAKDEGGNPEATILGTGMRTSCTMAAMVNAKIGNTHDNDDVFLTRMHIGTIPFCAALSAAEKVRASGKDVILATVLGYDICARCGLAVPLVEITPEKEVIYPAVVGYSFNVFGAAVSAAKLVGLNREQMRNALSLAAYFAPLPLAGLWRRRAPHNVCKYADLGWITKVGVTAALLAQNDYPGDEAILDADDFWKACGVSSFKHSVFLEDLGRKWHITESSIKPYPCCRQFNSSIDMLTKIMKQNTLRPDDIDSIKIKVPPLLLNPEYIWNKVQRWDSVEPKDYTSSEFSFPYNMACAAFGIPPGPEWHTSERMHDPQLVEFGKKIVLEKNPVSTETAEFMLGYQGPPGAFRKRFPVTIEVRVGERVFVESSDYARGDSWDPHYRLTHEEIKEKFRVNVSGFLSPHRTETVLNRIEKIEDVKDITEITGLL